MDAIEPQSLSAEFRHDVPGLRSSWGVTVTAAWAQDTFYNREILTERISATWGAYLETTAFAGIKTTLSVAGISSGKSGYLRRFYAPLRGGLFTGSEEWFSRQGATVSLSLSRAL